jgi:predicted nucleotidyltransferase
LRIERAAVHIALVADYSAYVSANCARLRASAHRPDQSDAALEAARRLARLLHEDLGVRRVLLFGSLARGRFTEHSDIDLAVEGTDALSWYRALRHADAITDFRFSLLPLEQASEHLRRTIEAEAIVLWPFSSLGREALARSADTNADRSV